MDDVEEVAGDLNTIYINIRGTLDNFAWSLRNTLGSENCRRLTPIKVQGILERPKYGRCRNANVSAFGLEQGVE